VVVEEEGEVVVVEEAEVDQIVIDVSDVDEKAIGPATAAIRQFEGAILVRLPEETRTRTRTRTIVLILRVAGGGTPPRDARDPVLPDLRDILQDLLVPDALATIEFPLPDLLLPNAEGDALLLREEMHPKSEGSLQDRKSEMEPREALCIGFRRPPIFPLISHSFRSIVLQFDQCLRMHSAPSSIVSYTFWGIRHKTSTQSLSIFFAHKEVHFHANSQSFCNPLL